VSAFIEQERGRFGVEPICETLGVSGGEGALSARTRGRRYGEKTSLLPWQQTQIAKAIRDKNPDQLRLPGFLWTRALVCELIMVRFGVRVTEKTAGRYLRRWGFSPQKPARRALEQNPDPVAQWLEEDYPAILQRAHRERAQILWADETGLRSDHTAGRSWSPVGQTPVVEGTGQRFGANVVSAISNKGRLQFVVFEQRFVAAVFIEFLARLVRNAGGQKTILILDGHPVHRAAKVRRWAEARADEIELVFLPGHSPELNPTGLLNQDVKTNALGRRRPHTQKELIDDTRAHPRSTQRRPRLVARPFHGKHVTYGRGRDSPLPCCGFGLPPAQIPASASNALGSSLGFWRRSARWARGVGCAG
jgi:transposase